MVLSAQELFAIEKMATTGTGNKKIATTLPAVVVPLKDTAQNTSCTHHWRIIWHSMALSTDTDKHRRHRQTPPVRNWAPTDPQMGPGAHFWVPNTVKWASPAQKNFLSVPQVVENTNKKCTSKSVTTEVAPQGGKLKVQDCCICHRVTVRPRAQHDRQGPIPTTYFLGVHRKNNTEQR